jgi:hypothetical protein
MENVIQYPKVFVKYVNKKISFYNLCIQCTCKKIFFSINFVFYMLNNCPVDIAYTFFIYVCNIFL